LQLEYAPAPPFDAGTPETAPPAIVERARTRAAPLLAQRERIVERVASRLIREASSQA